MREDRNLIWTKKFYLFLIITALYFINNYMRQRRNYWADQRGNEFRCIDPNPDNGTSC